MGETGRPELCSSPSVQLWLGSASVAPGEWLRTPGRLGRSCPQGAFRLSWSEDACEHPPISPRYACLHTQQTDVQDLIWILDNIGGILNTKKIILSAYVQFKFNGASCILQFYPWHLGAAVLLPLCLPKCGDLMN